MAFYEETKNRLSESMLQAEIQSRLDRDCIMFTCQQQSFRFLPEKKTAISQLDRLEEMMGLSWYENVNLGNQNVLDQWINDWGLYLYILLVIKRWILEFCSLKEKFNLF